MRLTRRGKYSMLAFFGVVAVTIFCTVRYWSPDRLMQSNIIGTWVVVALTLLVGAGYLLHDLYLAVNGTIVNAMIIKTINLGMPGQSIRYEFHSSTGELRQGMVDNAPIACVHNGQLPIVVDERTGWHTPVFMALVEKSSGW